MFFGDFYMYAIIKVGSNQHADEKFEHACVSKLNFVLPCMPFRV
jgi:hypothetical protein